MLTNRGVKARKRQFDSQDLADDRAEQAPATPRARSLPAERGGLSPRIARFLETATLPSPCLVVDVDLVEHHYAGLVRALPEANVFYAVKANPADEIVARLNCQGSNFDTASLGEIDLCLKHGVAPERISFHVGSQQTQLEQFDNAIAQAQGLFATLAAQGISLRMINVGGGFPSRYRNDVPPISSYGRAIRTALKRHFGANAPELIVEPGRYIVGDAGVITSEVVLVAHKGGTDERRWVYLDVGKFHGLAETMDEAIKYRVLTSHDGGETMPVVLAGPTCDSADILYEKTDYRLPKALKAGDKVLILSTGAYTTTYSSVGFNGMPPLASVCI